MADNEISADDDFREGLERILAQTGGFPLKIKGTETDLVILDAETFAELMRDATRYRDIVSPEVESGPAMDDEETHEKIQRGGDD